MRLFLFLIIIAYNLNYNLFAKDDDPENKCNENLPSSLPKIDELKPILNWLSSDGAQVSSAPCKSSADKSLNFDLIQNFIKSKIAGNSDSDKKNKNATINGVDFSDESPVMLNAFKSLTTSVDFMGEFKENQKDIQLTFGINPDCKKVMCAIEKIWGTQMGTKLLYLLLRHNFNGSEFAYNNTDRFAKNELDDVLLALDDMPLFFIPVGRENQRLSHFSKGFSLFGDSKTVADAAIILFDSWSEETDLEKQYTVFHELSHNLSSNFLNNIDVTPEWMAISGWVKKGDNWSSDKNACFLSRYSLTNSIEDFAESVSSYRYNGKKLKEKCPEKYQFIKNNVFKNLEYLDNRSCSPIESSDELKNLANVLNNDLKENMDLESELKKAKCTKNANIGPPNEKDAENCYLQIMKNLTSTISGSQIKVAAEKTPSADKNLSFLTTQLNEYFLNSSEKIEPDSTLQRKILDQLHKDYQFNVIDLLSKNYDKNYEEKTKKKKKGP